MVFYSYLFSNPRHLGFEIRYESHGVSRVCFSEMVRGILIRHRHNVGNWSRANKKKSGVAFRKIGESSEPNMKGDGG